MKRLVLLFAAMMLASGCVATAGAGPVSRPGRPMPQDPGPGPGQPGPAWVVLGNNYPAHTERQIVKPERPFRQIRVEAVEGSPVIMRIGIEYGEDDVQVVELNARLRPGTGETVDVARTDSIRRIFVYSDPKSGGSYSILAI